jgi:hypothetical protein
VDRAAIYLGSEPPPGGGPPASLPHPELREGRPSISSPSAQPAAARDRDADRVPGRQLVPTPASTATCAPVEPAAAMVCPLVARRLCLGRSGVRRVPHRWTNDQRRWRRGRAGSVRSRTRLYENARQAYPAERGPGPIIQSEKLAVVGTFASGPRTRSEP